MASTVTVLMSVYNSDIYLHEAIESILTQSFTDFEFLIINDASTDSSVAIIESYLDPRIRLIHNEQNIGLTKSLNKGLKLASGKYIARMDADDISLPNRLEEQVHFMERNKEIGVCGSWYQFIHNSGIIKKPTDHEEIKIALLRRNPIGHSTVILRKEMFEEKNLYYDEDFTSTQDYELWSRAAKVTKISNIPKVLVKYRMHEDQISHTKKKVQLDNERNVKRYLLQEIVDIVSEEELKLHGQAVFGEHPFNTESFKALNNWLVRLLNANERKKIYDEKNFFIFLSKLWKSALSKTTQYNIQLLQVALSSPFFKTLGKKGRARVIIKCLLGMR